MQSSWKIHICKVIIIITLRETWKVDLLSLDTPKRDVFGSVNISIPIKVCVFVCVMLLVCKHHTRYTHHLIWTFHRAIIIHLKWSYFSYGWWTPPQLCVMSIVHVHLLIVNWKGNGMRWACYRHTPEKCRCVNGNWNILTWNMVSVNSRFKRGIHNFFGLWFWCTFRHFSGVTLTLLLYFSYLFQKMADAHNFINAISGKRTKSRFILRGKSSIYTNMRLKHCWDWGFGS